ncbi:MAG: hypothetical protein IPH51_22735 [Rubrivivax sp.]|nr:hypothetical protein [Rubrivivax sp.]
METSVVVVVVVVVVVDVKAAPAGGGEGLKASRQEGRKLGQWVVEPSARVCARPARVCHKAARHQDLVRNA